MKTLFKSVSCLFDWYNVACVINVTAQASQLYSQCKSTLGSLWSGTTDKYGRLSLAAPPEDIAATTDDTALITYGVADMCDGAVWLGTRAQVLYLA